MRRVTAGASAARELREPEGKWCLRLPAAFPQGLKANQGTDSLQSGHPTLTTLGRAPTFTSFPGPDPEMIL